RSERGAGEESAAGSEVRVEDRAKRRVQPGSVDDVGAEDQVVAFRVGPRGPVGKGVLHGRNAVPPPVEASDLDGLLETIRLHDARAVRGGDDARKSRACP